MAESIQIHVLCRDGIPRSAYTDKNEAEWWREALQEEADAHHMDVTWRRFECSLIDSRTPKEKSHG